MKVMIQWIDFLKITKKIQVLTINKSVKNQGLLLTMSIINKNIIIMVLNQRLRSPNKNRIEILIYISQINLPLKIYHSTLALVNQIVQNASEKNTCKCNNRYKMQKLIFKIKFSISFVDLINIRLLAIIKDRIINKN